MTTKKTKTTHTSRSSSGDIIKLILDDHKPLKKLIKVMKNSEKSFSERRKAFMEFTPLLIAHAKPEEKTWYVFMKNNIEDMREEGFEGDTEHEIADKLVEEVKAAAGNEDLMSARIKVLAELVEHHIEEEEEEMLPDFKKKCHLEDRIGLGEEYLHMKGELAESHKHPTQGTYTQRLANRLAHLQ